MEAVIAAAEEIDAGTFIPDDKEFLYDYFTEERVEVLRGSLNPIRNALINLDAERYLSSHKRRDGDDDDGDDNNPASSRHEGINHTITTPIHNFITPKHPGIRYLHIAESTGRYSIGIFVFPPNAVIPLHNHPGMTVLSRILYGTVTVRTYDIIEPFVEHKVESKGPPPKSWMPKFMSRVWNNQSSSSHSVSTSSFSSHSVSTSSLVNNQRIPRGSIHVYENSLKKLSSSQISELYPTKGNVHEFTAGIHGAAVLDVLVPPYDADDDRDCTFYREDLTLAVPPQLPTTDDNDGSGNIQFDTARKRKWLVPIPQPSSFQCISGRYGGIGE